MSLFLFTRIAFELSYDSFFHDADRLYTVKTGWLTDGVPDGDEGDYTLLPIASTIAEEYPEQVEGSTTSCSLFGDDYRLGDRRVELATVLADTLYFRVLGLEVVAGNPQELATPDALFLSEEAAQRLFGNDGEAVGQTLQYDFWGKEATLSVRGVFRDVPLNTSLPKRPEAVVSLAAIGRYTQWNTGWLSGGNYNSFLRLRPGADAGWLNERLSALIARHVPADSGLELSVHIAPIRSRHLSDGEVRKMVWVMGLLAVALNYVLVSVASLTGRAKAIAVHKCSGATGGDIVRMFLTETALVIGLALLADGVLTGLFYERMEELAEVPLGLLFSLQNLWAPLAALLLFFLIGGGLPALLFARIPVTQVFRRYTSGRRGWKRTLLTVQFCGAAFILGTMLVVAAQYAHLTGRDRGWDARRVAYLSQRKVDAGQLRTQLRSLPYVESTATSVGSMTGFLRNRPVTPPSGGEPFYPRNTWFDSDFQSFIGLRLKEGRGLTGEGQLLVNSRFCEQMHWTDSPIGRSVDGYGTVTGLLDSFAFPDAPNDDVPVMVEWTPQAAMWMHVRLKEPFDENLQRLNEEMQRVYPQEELVFRSLEQEMRGYNRPLRIFRDVALLASVVILFIVLMGLAGYVNDEIRLRSKEIAIRKVNGARARDILRLLSRELLLLSLPAVATGLCCAVWTGRAWLTRFADVVPLPVTACILLGLFLPAFILGCVTVRGWRIANENPVVSLRSE